MPLPSSSQKINREATRQPRDVLRLPRATRRVTQKLSTLSLSTRLTPALQTRIRQETNILPFDYNESHPRAPLYRTENIKPQARSWPDAWPLSLPAAAPFTRLNSENSQR